MIVYDRLWETMKKRDMSQYRLIKEYGISQGQLNRIRKNQPISTVTMERFCEILECGLDDIAEYIPERPRK